jgi:putative proteasome-type protease
MTYCLAIALDEGLVFASDSRMYDSPDQISTNSKMHCFGTAGQRQLVLLCAGSLATTQAVVNRLQKDISHCAAVNLHTVDDLGAASDYLGEVFLQVQEQYGDAENAGFILGGQIAGQTPAAMLVYPQGNHITTGADTPYLQIGESKYGKPVLDRFLDLSTGLDHAARCAVISLDSTMRSNVSVGEPIEVLLYETDSLCVRHRVKLDTDSSYLRELRRMWDNKLREGLHSLQPLPMQLPADTPENSGKLPPG